MKNYSTKIYLFFFIYCLSFSQFAYSQKLNQSLNTADSLYTKGSYSKSLIIYKVILEEGQEYSPKMLLKMAFMEEASHHYANSMYYLNLYYNLKPNRNVLRKMEEVAQSHGLTGYVYHDSDFFITQFKKYYMKVLELMLSVAVVAVTFLALNKRQTFFQSTVFRFGFLAYLIWLFYYINLLHFRQYGICKSTQAALMSAPSAGANWLATITPGHRLNVTGENDIWYEVKWNNQKAFIRKQNLQLLPE